MSGDREHSKGVISPPRDELGRARENLRKAYPIDESSYLAELLRDIEEAYRQRRRAEKDRRRLR